MRSVMYPRGAMATDTAQREFDERVIAVDRVARVMAGGRRFRFRALVIVGDHNGRVGMALAKGSDVSTAVSKASEHAKARLINVPITENGSIPHDITTKFAGAKVFLKPAGPGTGVIAGGAVREVLEAVGVRNVLSKALGSSSKINNAYATLEALRQLQADPKTSKAKGTPEPGQKNKASKDMQ